MSIDELRFEIGLKRDLRLYSIKLWLLAVGILGIVGITTEVILGAVRLKF